MNEQTRYVMGIYQFALLIGDALEYAIPSQLSHQEGKEPVKYSIEAYETRQKMLKHLLEENSPIVTFCKNNGETGEKILNQLKEFSRDVFNVENDGVSTPIVNIVNDSEGQKELRVESSLMSHLLDLIVGLHETLLDIIHGFIVNFKKDQVLEPELEELIAADDRFYRAQAMFVVSCNICSTFIEYNNTVRQVLNEKKAQGVDINSPDFKYENEPSIYFINQELGKLFGYGNFIKEHNRTSDDAFIALFDSFGDKKHYFSGTKKLAEGQTIYSAMNEFQNIFKDDITSSGEAWKKIYNQVYLSLIEFEKGAAKTEQVNEAE